MGIGGDFTERVAIEHQLQEYEADLEKWQRSLMNQTEVRDVVFCFALSYSNQ